MSFLRGMALLAAALPLFVLGPATEAAWVGPVELQALPDCPDTGGGHLNFSLAGGAFTCGNTESIDSVSRAPALVFASPAATSGTPSFRGLVGTDLPAPSATTLGGIESLAPATHQFLTTISTAGVPSAAQPSVADISGLGSMATQGAGSVAITGGTANGMTIGATAPAAGTFSALTSAGPVTFSGAGPFTISVAPTTSFFTGDIVSNFSQYNYPSANEWSRAWSTQYFATAGTYTANTINTYHNVTTGLGACSGGVCTTYTGPTFTATVSAGAVTAFNVINPGSALPSGTYNFFVRGGGGTGAAGTFVVSGGSVSGTPTVTSGGSAYTSSPAVGGQISLITGEWDDLYAREEVDAGVYFNSTHQIMESALANYGVINGGFYGYNIGAINEASGFLGNYNGIACGMGNYNPSIGSVGGFTCLYRAGPVGGQTPTGTGGVITATASGGSITLAITNAGTGYQNSPPGTTWQLQFAGCVLPPVATFTTSGGAITATNVVTQGYCAVNPTVTMLFGSMPPVGWDNTIDDQDQYASWLIAGNVFIGNGSIQAPALTTQLQIKAYDASGITSQLSLLDSANHQNFHVISNGVIDMHGSSPVLNLGGSSGSGWGRISFCNATGTCTTLNSPSSGTLGNSAITVPNVAAPDTMAVLGTAQTFTAEQSVSLTTSGAALSLANTAGACTHTPGSSSETVSCSSDAKFKSQIRDAWLHDLMSGWLWDFGVRDYIWNATGQRVIGVVAQELVKVHPEMVHKVTALPPGFPIRTEYDATIKPSDRDAGEKDGYYLPSGLPTYDTLLALSHEQIEAASYLAVDEPNVWRLVLAVQELQAFAALVCMIALLSWMWHFWHWHRHHRGGSKMQREIDMLQAVVLHMQRSGR